MVTARHALTWGLAAVAFALVAPACRHEEKRVDEVALAPAEPPVAPPADLLADVLIATPQTTWSRVQRGVGGALGIMPSTIGGLVCALSGIDPTLGPEIDGMAPAYAVMAGDPAAPSFAIVVKLVDARKTRIALVEGDTARYVAHDAAGMAELTPRTGPSPMALGLTRGGLLVLARTPADLERLGPYAYRSLPTRALPSQAVEIDLPGAALGGALRERLDAEWSAWKTEMLNQEASIRATRGREADFADPRGLMATLDSAVQARLAALGDVKRARITLDASEDAVRADLLVTPNDGDGPARKAVSAMRPGDVTPLLSAPASAPVALIVRDDAAARARDAADFEVAMARMFGKHLSDADAKKVHVATEDWTKGRGDWLTAALSWDDAKGLVVRAAAADEDVLSRAVREGLELTRASVLRDPLKRVLRLREPVFSSIELRGDDAGESDARKVELATTAFEPRAPGVAAQKIGVAWSVAHGELRVSLAENAPALLAQTQKGARTLADEPAIARAVASLGADATFAFVAQPLRFDAPRAGAPPAPLVFAWGRRGEDAWTHIDVADLLLRDVLKSRTGL
jgi:hypothetical protein